MHDISYSYYVNLSTTYELEAEVEVEGVRGLYEVLLDFHVKKGALLLHTALIVKDGLKVDLSQEPETAQLGLKSAIEELEAFHIDTKETQALWDAEEPDDDKSWKDF